MFLLRPPETRTEDLQEVLEEAHGTKRSLSPDGPSSAPSKCSKTDSDECLMTELIQENGTCSKRCSLGSVILRRSRSSAEA